ncbi:MAG: PfkB family carbohydrate kinase [Nanoarchaeota archaeon]|nr:PfkB family carbohydrate kinase [Nanoarchaeota archaeon]
MYEHKIKSIEELKEILDSYRFNGKRIVLCHGCFDLVHYGHILHFLNSKEQGDILVVTVTPDKFIQKGPGRPFFKEDIRIKHLANIECIDYVTLNKWDTAIETIKVLKPHIYSKGKEVLDNKTIDEISSESLTKSNLSLEIEALESIGGKLHLTDDLTFSSSNILNQIASMLPEETKIYLSELKKNFNSEYMVKVLESLNDIRVLVIGDSILDEYIYCHVLDKVGKEPIVAYKFMSSETYLGGAFAVASDLTSFTNNISLITCIGKNSYEFIETNLNKYIERNIFIQNESETLVKKRFVDYYKNIKNFEIYNTDGLILNKNTEDKIIKYLNDNLHRFDLIIVADFGHGFITEKILDYLTNCNKFLAINCQLNAGNFGYNFITKYKKADFASINSRELRLPFQEKNSDIKIPIKKLSEKLNLHMINVTLGKSGNIYYHKGEHYHVPAFTESPIDTVGAGDEVLALTSLLSYKNAHPQAISFLGNCIGALAVKIMGNKSQVSLTELKKFVSYIMR